MVQGRSALIVSALVGVLFGLVVLFAVKQMREPALYALLDKQMKLLEMQMQIQQRLLALEDEDTDEEDDMDAPVAMPAAVKQGAGSDLGARIAAIEKQLKGTEAFFEQVKNQPPPPPPEDFAKKYDIPVALSAVKGPKDAPVTIVVFTDFQCPFCSKFHAPINEVLKAYPDKVNFIIKHFPLGFHPMAKPAAKAVFAAGEQGKYWEMVELIFADQKNMSAEKFVEYAQKLALDVEKYKKDLVEKDAQWEKNIAADMSLAEKVAVRGTPTFYVNGRKTRARDFESFKKEIDAILMGEAK